MKKTIAIVGALLVFVQAFGVVTNDWERIGALGRNDIVVTGQGWATLTNEIAEINVVTNGLVSKTQLEQEMTAVSNSFVGVDARITSATNAIAELGADKEVRLTVTNGVARNGNVISVDPTVTNGFAKTSAVMPKGGTGLVTFNVETGAVNAQNLTAQAGVKSYGEVEDGSGNRLSQAAKAGELKTVAFTGNYYDLQNRPAEQGGAIDWEVVTNRVDSIATNSALTAVAPLQSQVNAWETYWDGSNVIWQVTNYYGYVDTPKLKLLELRDGSYREVWNDITKFALFETNMYSRVAQNATNQYNTLKEEVQEISRNWGNFTALSGTLAPSNQVWINSAEAVFAAGLEYERVAVGNGSIAVLTAKGDVSTLGGQNGSFRITSSDGTSFFGFSKTSSYTVGCNCDAITVSGNAVTLRYDIIQNDPPVIYYKSSLSVDAWTQLTEETSPSVQTSFVSGSWYAVINVGTTPQGFFRAESTVEGSSVFDTNMPARFDGGIMATNRTSGAASPYISIRPVYNNGTITWEVAQ